MSAPAVKRAPSRNLKTSQAWAAGMRTADLSRLRFADVSHDARARFLREQNARRVDVGEPPYSEVLQRGASFVSVRCCYCGQVHRHAGVRVGMHVIERCEDPPDDGVGYVLAVVSRMQLWLRQADEARERGEIIQ